MDSSTRSHSIFHSSNDTVTSLYASGHPAIKCPKDAVEMLLSTKATDHSRSEIKDELAEHDITQAEMDAAAECGRFPNRPSDLFLKLFHGAMRTLEHDPRVGCVSPSLMGASGVIPLTIISTIPDIMQHYHDVIVHAQKEVLFATCWWQKGETANIMNNALRELNKRAGVDQRRVIVKLMIDHFTKGNLVHSHSIVPPSHWSHCNILASEELPYISMEVNSYHRIIMGAFHSKFLVVDRKIALLNSNNIYDRPNLEMMVHYEGDIVNSFYDTYLTTWQLPFQPDLVCAREPASAHGRFHFRAKGAKTHLPDSLTAHLNGFSPSAQGTRTADDLSEKEVDVLSTDFTPFVYHSAHAPVPIALVSRIAHGAPGHRNTLNPQNAAWLGAFRYAQRSIFIQSPMFNASEAIDGVLAACRRGVKVTLWLDLGYDYLKEGFGTFQGGTNERVVQKMYHDLEGDGNGGEKNLCTFWYTAKDQTHPFHFSQKQRNCHIKFMSIDDQVAIMGSGNMDTQTWCHSQELNTMVDSPLLVRELLEALHKNQSTNEYGRVSDDGNWHDNHTH